MNRKFLKLGFIAVLILLIMAGTGGHVFAESPAEFYKGKMIELYVPYGPGGAMDTTARLLAAGLEKKTGSTVVVRNMPGAGTCLAINYLYEKAKRDGLTLSMLAGTNAITYQLLGREEARFDLRKMNLLYLVGPIPHVSGVRPDSPYQSLSDLIAAQKPVTTGSPGLFSSAAIVHKLALGRALGVPIKVIGGYKSGPEYYLATLRGEVDIAHGTYSSMIGYFREGKLRSPFITWNKRLEGLPDVPTIYEEAEKAGKLTSDAKYWIDATVTLLKYYRAIVTTPGVPPERVKFLRDTLDTVLNDKRLKGNLIKLGIDLDYAPGEQAQKEVTAMVNMEEDKLELFRNNLLK